MRKSDLNIEEVGTNFERFVLDSGETMTSVSFGTGKSFRGGNTKQFFSSTSTLSECSYNTVMQICDYLGCEPEDILEENEANGVLALSKSFGTIVKNVTPMCHRFTASGAENYFQAFLRRNDLSFAWIIEYPSGRIIIRAGRFKAEENHLEGGVAYEAVYNSDLSDLNKLYISHRGVKILTPVPQNNEKVKSNTSDAGGKNFDSGMSSESASGTQNPNAGGKNFDSGSIETGGSNFDSGLSSASSLSSVNNSEAGGSNFDRGTSDFDPTSLDFSFRSQVEGVVEVNRPVPIMRNKKLFAALDERKLQVLPYDDLSGKFLEFLKGLYNSDTGFEELTHADFMRAIYSIMSPFKNKQMRKELTKK